MVTGDVRWFRSHPAAQLAVGALAVALAFPSTAAGECALVLLAGSLGVLVATFWPTLRSYVEQPPALATALVLLIITAAGITTFWDVMTTSQPWQLGDWGPQHAVLAHIMPSLPGIHVPVWDHAVATGDPPLELYPALTYLVTGHVALALGLENDLPQAMMLVAVVVHITLALLTALLAMRFAPKPIALVLGMLFMLDGGAISHGGTVGLFKYAILHSALAQVFTLIAALGILSALSRPRLGASVAIWLGTALATATHPSALIAAAVCIVGLLAVALLASDVPARRAFVAIGHVVLGIALSASVWLPGGERLLAYGQHFSNELYSGREVLETLIATAMPITSYAAIIYAGYLGTLVGVFSRRAEVVFISVVALALLIGLSDAPYAALGLFPGMTVARLGAIRLMLVERPFLYAAAAYIVAMIYGRARDAWRDAPARQRIAVAALLGVVVGGLVRVGPSYWHEESDRANTDAHWLPPDPASYDALLEWARVHVREIGPGSYARAMFETDSHEPLHLTATTGLPTLHLGALPDLLLRERISDSSPASLARFNVKWSIAAGKSPELGDPKTETTVGDFHIREIPDWDGKFARVEAGEGSVVVTRLDDNEVDVEVTATAPVLVALGTGYYPRWRATYANGTDEPVYALPAIEAGPTHVVSAWLAPGKTTFTCDGPLPSDGDGRLLSIAAMLLAAAAIIVWSRRRWRTLALLRIVALRRRVKYFSPWIVRLAAPVAIGLLAVRGCRSARAPESAILVGSGLRSDARVEARIGAGAWESCDHSPSRGDFRCAGLATIADGSANLANDAAPSWAFTTPAIVVNRETEGVEVRISMTARLAGRYWAAASADTDISFDGDVDHVQATALIDLDDKDHDVVITAVVPSEPLRITVVADTAIQPDRAFLVRPPPAPPAAISALVSPAR